MSASIARKLLPRILTLLVVNLNAKQNQKLNLATIVNTDITMNMKSCATKKGLGHHQVLNMYRIAKCLRGKSDDRFSYRDPRRDRRHPALDIHRRGCGILLFKH